MHETSIILVCTINNNYQVRMRIVYHCNIVVFHPLYTKMVGRPRFEEPLADRPLHYSQYNMAKRGLDETGTIAFLDPLGTAVCVLFALNVLSTRRHPAQPVSSPILQC